jgi:Tfp pilus assembly protein PilO
MNIGRIARLFHFNRFFWGMFCVLVLANLVFHWAIIRHQERRIEELQESYKARRTSLVSERNGPQERILKAARDIESFRGQIPVKAKFTEVAAELSGIFARRGLPLEEMSYKPEHLESRALLKYSTSLRINGKYEQLKALLADIQGAKRLFCIEDIVFSNQSAQTESVKLGLSIATYFRE